MSVYKWRVLDPAIDAEHTCIFFWNFIEAQNLHLEKNLSERRSQELKRNGEHASGIKTESFVLFIESVIRLWTLKMHVFSQLLLRLERNVEEYVAGESLITRSVKKIFLDWILEKYCKVHSKKTQLCKCPKEKCIGTN